MLVRLLGIVACVAVCWFNAASAEDRQLDFDVRFTGLKVAELALAIREEGGAYALAGRARSTGMAAIFRALRFEMMAEGVLDGPSPQATRYVEDIDTGRRASTVALRFGNGGPIIDALTPDRPAEPWDIVASEQTGTIDPLSALYRLARPREEAALCDWRQDVFDGRRRSELALGAPVRGGATITCNGAYRRVAGFPPGDMAERQDFPFTATFSEEPDGLWVLTRVDLQSLYGAVRITRSED